MSAPAQPMQQPQQAQASSHPLEPIAFRRLLDLVLVPAKRHFRRFFLPVAAPIAGAGLLVGMLQIGWYRSLASDGDFAAILPMLGGVFLLVVLVMAVYSLAFGALLVASLDAVAGRAIAWRRAWLFVLRPPVFGTMVVVTVLQFFSVLMCFLPVLYVAPTLIFVMPVMVEEDRYGWAAIRRSAQLAHYNPTRSWTTSSWLKTIVFFATATMITYAVSLTVQLPFLITQQIFVFREAAAGAAVDPEALLTATLWLQIPTQILGACATAAAWLYWTFGISLFYREIRRQREGADLRQAIDELVGRLEPAPAEAPA